MMSSIQQSPFRRQRIGQQVKQQRDPSAQEPQGSLTGRQRVGYEVKQRLIDRDGDGRCRENGRRWVPCPPGIGAGTNLRRVGRQYVGDLDSDASIDEIKGLPAEYRKRMKERMKRLGITRGMMKRQLRKKFRQADPELVEQAKKWYGSVSERTRELVAELNQSGKNKVSFEQAAAVIAALSPAREFGKNVRDAKTLLRVHSRNEPFEIPDDVATKFASKAKPENKQRLDKVLRRARGNRLRPSTFRNDEIDLLVGVHPELSKLGNTTGLVNAIRGYSVLRDIPIDTALGGPKMRSFYSNIVNPDGDRATIDTWMYRAMIPDNHEFSYVVKKGKNKGKEITGTLKVLEKQHKKRTQDMFQSTPGGYENIPNGVGLYPEFVQAVREVAEELGLAPAALQAIIWEVQRESAGNKRTAWDAIERQFRL